MWKKILKYFASFALVVFLLLALLGLFTQTPVFRSWLKSVVVKQVNKSLNAELSLGKINGNLFQSLQLENVLLQSENDTLAFLKFLHVKVRPSHLFKKTVFVDVIRVEDLVLFVKQQSDSVWNYQQIVKSSTKAESPDTTTSGPFDWKIDLQNVQVVDVSINYQPLQKSVIPTNIKNINVDLSLQFTENELYVDLKDFRLNSLQPDFVLSSLSFVLQQQGSKLLVENLFLQTPKSSINATAELHFTESPYYNISLQSDSLFLKELSPFVNIDFPDLIPMVNLDFVLEKNIADLNLFIKADSEKIQIDGTVENPFDEPKYDLLCKLLNFNLGTWIPENRFANIISGEIKVDGLGTNPQKLSANVFAKLYSPVENSLITELTLDGNWVHDSLNADLRLAGVAGMLSADVQIGQVIKNPKYSANLKTQNLNLFPILNDSLFASDIQLEAELQGVGFVFPKLNTEIDALISHSHFSGLQVDSLSLVAHFQNGDYTINSLKFNSPYLTANVNGDGNLDEIKMADLQVNLDDLDKLKTIIKQDVKGNGNISGQVFGSYDSLATNLLVDLHDVEFGDYSLSAFENITSGVLTKGKFSGRVDMFTGKGKIQNINLDTLTLDIQIDDSRFDYKLDFTANDSVRLFFAANTILDSTINTEIQNVLLGLGDQTWKAESKAAIVEYSQKRLSIQDFVLKNQEQLVAVNGYIEPAGEQNVQVTVKGLSINPILQFSGTTLPWDLSAKLDLDAFLFGTAKSPEIKTQILLQNIFLDKRKFPELKTVAEYKMENLNLQANLMQDKGGEFDIKMDAPFHLSFIDSSGLFDKEKPVSATVDAKTFDLAFLSVLTPMQDEIKGTLDAELTATSVLPQPTISGHIGMQNGSYLLNEYGLDYQDIKMDIEINDEKLAINKMYAKAGEGDLNASGTAQFLKGQYLKGPQEIDLQLKGQKLQVAKSRGVEMVVNSDISLHGNPEEIIFGGNVKVLRSKINLSELPGGQSTSRPLVKARLVQAFQDSVIRHVKKTEQESQAAQNLRGRMTVEIPRNTWVRSQDMNIELSGELELVKRGTFFELFGNVQTIRGTYNLYGRRFNIQEGEVNFQGGKNVNPIINLDAVYSFRNIQGDKTKLHLKTTGTLLEPKIAFELNDLPIEEADGISYIVFGKSSNDLSRGEKSEVSKQGGSGAQITSVLSGQVTAPLTQAIQNTFNLDVMEFRGGSNWRQASIVIGKYLTNDLYMAYEREFNVGKTQNVIPEKVSLEYEITPRIFIQATKGDDKSTGFDVIWKIEKK